MALSEFERKRQENIQRNKQLLEQLELDTISASLPTRTPTPPTKKRKTATSHKPVKKEVVEPTRRSRRIAGIQTELENPEEYARIQEEQEEKERQKKEIEKLKRTKLFVEDNGQSERVLHLIQSLGDKFSAGDFYEFIRSNESDKSLEEKRKKFDKLHIYKKHDPLDIKMSHGRITAMHFHPATKDRLILGGDTFGNVGIWCVDDTNPIPAITILHPHGRNISKILTPAHSPSKIYSASYDGSVRELDLHKLSTNEVAYLNDPYEKADYPLGVSDINHCIDDPHILYMTTLEGHFYKHDTRTPFKSTSKKGLLRLHDKKIGGFAINPNASYQIATASLDRTLRIWDLRNIGKSTWSEFDQQNSPHAYGSYGSRLSVSCVDWNSDNHLVCNGYDDNILKKDEEEAAIPENLTPFTKIRHNCQTGRWVSILKSRWQPTPADGIQKFVIANMNRGLDIYDQQGQMLARLNESVGAVPAVSTFHPSQNWVVGGSASGKVYLFE
ncbi:uncharacterized protein SPAPADRAFT_144487 [Spathaspora passalidarum NRRL Y-27907]|uniref:DNA damage-binding protein CMR1 n=1 Tax=Spathaspora passalidarum (strain NRRL Y-27907 / 11-Y1) TaxID=619300 RepID=G3AV47_SPAPN|nr:uncharacterized protein SPAPADRAFT_144487 [Spathaspora passalidarum NRRL Y-27907]EGW30121.1 hypothetical protein SPAPADRAFT_144487 [Spathaspora passalidarum NRRL Y-27907]